jgi:hypothetical protein
LLRRLRGHGTGGKAPWTEDCVLALQAEAGSEGAAALMAIGTSDMSLLIAACRNVAASLAGDGRQGMEQRAADWAAAAGSLECLPPAWRHDHVVLQREQVNPDYEHLWLRLSNARYGERRWAAFDFRLSASNVRRGCFSHLPKLEFPLAASGERKQFDNWFEESEDDMGPKFELRFDIKARAMDVDNWGALSRVDQASALALVRQLPDLLRCLEADGTQIHRAWTDWHQMVAGIQRVMTACLQLDPEVLAHAADHTAAV